MLINQEDAIILPTAETHGEFSRQKLIARISYCYWGPVVPYGLQFYHSWLSPSVARVAYETLRAFKIWKEFIHFEWIHRLCRFDRLSGNFDIN